MNAVGLPSITLGIAAFNEEESIAKSIRSILLASQYIRNDIEFIVVASGCTDRTVEMAHNAFCDDGRARIVCDASRLSKCAALNLLAECARGEILVFVDADVQVEPQTLRLLSEAFFNDPKLSLAFGRMIPQSGSSPYWTRIGEMTSQALHAIRGLPDGSGLWLVCGPLFAIRADVWPRLPDGLTSDDVYLGVLFTSNGRQVLYLPEAVAFGMYPQTMRDLISQKLRNRIARLQLRTLEGEAFRRVPLWMVSFALPRLKCAAIRHLPILLIDTLLCAVALLLWAAGHKANPLWKQLPSTKLR